MRSILLHEYHNLNTIKTWNKSKYSPMKIFFLSELLFLSPKWRPMIGLPSAVVPICFNSVTSGNSSATKSSHWWSSSKVKYSKGQYKLIEGHPIEVSSPVYGKSAADFLKVAFSFFLRHPRPLFRLNNIDEWFIFNKSRKWIITHFEQYSFWASWKHYQTHGAKSWNRLIVSHKSYQAFPVPRRPNSQRIPKSSLHLEIQRDLSIELE